MGFCLRIVDIMHHLRSSADVSPERTVTHEAPYFPGNQSQYMVLDGFTYRGCRRGHGTQAWPVGVLNPLAAGIGSGMVKSPYVENQANSEMTT